MSCRGTNKINRNKKNDETWLLKVYAQYDIYIHTYITSNGNSEKVQVPVGIWFFKTHLEHGFFPSFLLMLYVPNTLYVQTYSHYCIWFCFCICFSVLRVLQRPTRIDNRCQVISGFGHHLGLCAILSLDLMPVSIRYQTRWILSISNYFIVNFKSTRLWPCL